MADHPCLYGTGRGDRVVLAPNGPDTVSRTADINRAKAILGWQPEVSMDEGLKRTYSWIESVLKEKG